jgi:hypothetical protein
VVLRRIYLPKMFQVKWKGEYCIMRSLMNCTTYPKCVRDQAEKNKKILAFGMHE